MPRADGVKERGNPVLYKHFIIYVGSLVQGQTVLKSFASPTRHCQANPAGFHPCLHQGLFKHLDRGVGQREQRLRRRASVFEH